MIKIIDSEYLLEEQIFFREEPNVRIHRAKTLTDNKPCLIKIWQIHRNGMNGNNYQLKFQHQNSLLTQSPEGLSQYLPCLLAAFTRAKLTETSTDLVSCQIFQDIKYNNIMWYHHRNSMIPEQVAVYLYRHVVKAVGLMNAESNTLFCLNPTYIMIDKDLNPKFMDLSNVRKLNCAEDVDKVEDYQVTKNFQPPELFKQKGTINLLKMDSYQLGILGISLLLTGNPPFDTATPKDVHYKMVIYGQFCQFFKSRIPGKVVSLELQNLIETLIAHDPIQRIDPKDIICSKWWEQTQPEICPSPLFDQYVNRILEQKQKEEISLKVKIKAFIPQDVKPSLHPLFRSGFSSRRSSSPQLYTHLTPSTYSGKPHPNIYYHPHPLYDTFHNLKQKSKLKFNSISESAKEFIFSVASLETKLRMEIAVYAHENLEGASVVKYRLMNSDKFEFGEGFENAVEFLESVEYCQQ